MKRVWRTDKTDRQTDGRTGPRRAAWSQLKTAAETYPSTSKLWRTLLKLLNRQQTYYLIKSPGLILGLHPANERRRYCVTTSLIVRAQTYRSSPGHWYSIEDRVSVDEIISICASATLVDIRGSNLVITVPIFRWASARVRRDVTPVR